MSVIDPRLQRLFDEHGDPDAGAALLREATRRNDPTLRARTAARLASRWAEAALDDFSSAHSHDAFETRVVAALRQHITLGLLAGVRVLRPLGWGGYSVVFEVEYPAAFTGQAAWKIPCPLGAFFNDHPDATPRGLGPNRITLISATGPFALRAPGALSEADQLLRSATQALRDTRPPRPIAQLIGALELEGIQTTFTEVLHGISLCEWLASTPGDVARWSMIAVLAEAVARLRETGFTHGDLKPEHIIWTASDEVVFIDPLGPGQDWFGSIGYSLPPHTAPLARLAFAHRDMLALAAITAEVFGGDLGWDARLAYRIANIFNGRFAWRLTPEKLRDKLLAPIPELPPQLEAWIHDLIAREHPDAPWEAWMLERLVRIAHGHGASPQRQRPPSPQRKQRPPAQEKGRFPLFTRWFRRR